MIPPQIIPVVLCGGKGSRLWPLSTAEKPKVFHCLTGEYSLFQETLLRCRSPVFASRPIIVGSAKHHILIAEQLAETAVTADILLEPCGRDSLPAVLAGALYAYQRQADAVILILASDHFIPDVDAFTQGVEQAQVTLERRDGVVFGVEPDQPSEAFGYIKPGKKLQAGEGFELLQFEEKPKRAKAQDLIAQGWLWNSGNFLCTTKRLLSLASQFEPDALLSVERALQSHQNWDGAKILGAADFSALKPQSFDRSILEQLQMGTVLPVRYKWRDLGSWDAIIALENEYSPSRLIGINHNRA